MARSVEEQTPGVYILALDGDRLLATRNLTPGRRVYGEELVTVDEVEYRFWNPSRSKLGAAIIFGLKENPIKPGTRVLYLGVASGTTCSHVSDIVGEGGHVWGVDFAPRPVRDLIDNVARYRSNITPILADARQPQSYSYLVPRVDVIFSDVAQPDQAEIVVKNARFLRRGGHAMLSIKSRSVDVMSEPSAVYAGQVRVLEESGFEIEQVVELEPYEIDHALALAKFP